MNRAVTIALGLAAAVYAIPVSVSAQEAPPTYLADPGVYKVIFEDERFRVILATWKPGEADKPHSHPVPSVVYSLTNCTNKLTSADGQTRIAKSKAGEARAVPYTASHVAKNIGRSTCRVLFVEHK